MIVNIAPASALLPLSSCAQRLFPLEILGTDGLSFVDCLKNMGGQVVTSIQHAEEMAKKMLRGDPSVDPNRMSLELLNASKGLQQLSAIVSAATHAFQDITHIGV